MENEIKQKIRKDFGEYLRNRRINELNQKNLLEFSFSTYFDNSKLAKIENGEVNIGFYNLLEIAEAYKLSHKDILGFTLKFGTTEDIAQK